MKQNSMRKKIFFLIVILIVLLAGFFASTKPDGLDFVAEKLGLRAKVINHSLMPSYTIPHMANMHLSAAVAGIIGVVFILLFFTLLKLIFNHRTHK